MMRRSDMEKSYLGSAPMIAMRRIFFFTLALSLLTAIGCAPGKVTREWSEEVALDDGRLVTIDRRVQFQESNSLAGDAYNATETSSTISFRDELSILAKWDAPLVPILLYQDKSADEWVIVATTSSCEVWSARGSPRPPYWEFRQKPKGWQPHSLSPSSFERKSNLFFAYDSGLPAKHITSSLTNQSRDDVRVYSDYKVISANAKSNCN